MMSPSALVIGLASTALAAGAAWAARALWKSRARRRDVEAIAPAGNECGELHALRHSHALLQEQLQWSQVRACEAERELASLAYSVSHDLRAPLRGIDGFSQALTEDYGHRLDPTAHDYLRRVRAGAAHMNAMIDDLLSLSRVARAPFRLETVDMSALAREIARDLSATEPVRLVRWDIPANLSATADRTLLAEALRQLLANAWKFTAPRDQAQISLGVLPPDPAHPAGTVYQVRDNGVGFDLQYAGRLFGAFQRMHTADEFPAGRGIGLALVQKIVHRHGGVVWAEASPEQGARFSFTLEGVAVQPEADRPPVGGAQGPLPAAAGVQAAAVPKATPV